jgi:adenosylcobinamide-GDP ribazoletransferase
VKWQPLKKQALINHNFPSFWLALSFYTRLPCPKNLDYSQLPRAAIYLPLIGYLVGGVAAIIFYVAQFFWSPTVSILLAVIAGIFITGAFHEDGFADVCDGFGGGYEKERILQIMKDSAIGVYGALGLGLLIALKIITLVSLPLEKLPIIFISAHSLSRLAPLFLMRFYDYARLENSKVQNAIFQPTHDELCFASICATLPLFFLPAIFWFSFLPLGLMTLFLGQYFQQKIGGYTGDCLGATQQISETIFYLSMSALWKFI